jgi:hypothetical protein
VERDYDGALALAKEIWIPYRLTQALESIVPQLPSSHLSEALEVARSIADNSARADALAVVVDFLPETEREAVLHDALSHLQHNDEGHQAWAIAAFGPFLPRAALLEALAAVETMSDKSLPNTFLTNS